MDKKKTKNEQFGITLRRSLYAKRHNPSIFKEANAIRTQYLCNGKKPSRDATEVNQSLAIEAPTVALRLSWL